MYKTIALIGSAAYIAGAPVTDVTAHRELEEVDGIEVEVPEFVNGVRGRELFPSLAVGNKCGRRGCFARDRAAARRSKAMMAIGQDDSIKGPIKALQILAESEDQSTTVTSSDSCTRRHAMAKAAGIAAGLALATVSAPGFAAETKMVKMGSDSGQLVFVPDEIKICKGDTVTWVNNKGGPHNVLFDEEAVPSGVNAEALGMESGEQLADEAATYSKKFDTAGSYGYYCEPHRGAGMNAVLIVE